MSGRRRRELADSFRLVTGDEQWLLRDLLVGVVALVAWIGGTGWLAIQVADPLGVSLGLAAGESPSSLAVAVLGALWLVFPAVAVAVRIRRRVLNLRDNVEQYYRFEHPAALLAPPALLVAVVAAVAVALGEFPWYFTLVLLPVGIFALVRTLAFSYRVYSFSHPLAVQFFTAVSTAVGLGSALAAVASATGRASLVDQALRVTGAPTGILGTASVGGVAVSGAAVAATLPVALALAYALVQTAVSVVVRHVEPTVDRSAMRTGQRYPPFLDSTTPVGTPDGSVESATADGVSTADGGTTATSGDAADAAGGPASADADADDADEDLDDVSNTRVFTPPADDGDGGLGTGGGVGGGTDSASGVEAGTGSDAGSETRSVPGAETDETPSTGDRGRCEACGESFSVDAAVRFCPNCGTALGPE